MQKSNNFQAPKDNGVYFFIYKYYNVIEMRIFWYSILRLPHNAAPALIHFRFFDTYRADLRNLFETMASYIFYVKIRFLVHHGRIFSNNGSRRRQVLIRFARF